MRHERVEVTVAEQKGMSVGQAAGGDNRINGFTHGDALGTKFSEVFGSRNTDIPPAYINDLQ